MTQPVQNAATFTINKPIKLIQLRDELNTALALSVQLVALTGYDQTQPISANNTATLWVTPNTVNPTTVNNTIAAHIPNSSYGVPIQEQNYALVLAKVNNSSTVTLSADELQTAVRGLLMRVNNLPTVPTTSGALPLPGSPTH